MSPNRPDGIESSSHRVGLFFDANVIEVELVTGNGDLISCRADNEHAELFRSLPWSCKSTARRRRMRLRCALQMAHLALL